MKSLILAEHDNNILKESTLATVTAAAALGGDVHIVVVGASCAGVAQNAARVAGVTHVWLADSEAYQHMLAETVAPLLVTLMADYDALLAPATSQGKNILPRVAAHLDVMQISDITAVRDDGGFERPIYGGQAFATVQSADSKKVITVRTTAFAKAGMQEASAPVAPVSASASQTDLASFVRAEQTKSDRPELTTAKVIVSGGRGMGSAEAFHTVIEPLADKLGAAIGASRAAVDAGYMPNDAQVGQTGKIVAPDLYIAAGISGAIQHLAGMKDSKVIVAINKDEDAPIFQVADYGLVADLFQALPEMTQKL